MSDEDFNSFNGRTSKQDAVADEGCSSCCKLCKNNRGDAAWLFFGTAAPVYLLPLPGSASARGPKRRLHAHTDSPSMHSVSLVSARAADRTADAQIALITADYSR